MTTSDSEPTVPLSLFSAAMDEIWFLRSLGAVEADMLADLLSLRTLPVTARADIELVVERLRHGARGESWRVHKGITTETRKDALRSAGAKETFTRWDLEREIAERKAAGVRV